MSLSREWATWEASPQKSPDRLSGGGASHISNAELLELDVTVPVPDILANAGAYLIAVERVIKAKKAKAIWP